MAGLCNQPCVPASPFSPGNVPWAPPQGCGCGGLGGTTPHPPLPLPPAKGAGSGGASECSPARTALRKTRALVGAEIRAVGFPGALGLLSASALPYFAPAKLQSTRGSSRSRAPWNGSGWEAEAGWSPPAPLAPRNVYLYQLEQLHQEKHQLSLSRGHFWLHRACGEGGLRHLGGALPPRGMPGTCPCSTLHGGG